MEFEKLMQMKQSIGTCKDKICLLLHGQVSRQPKRCRSAMLDPKGRAFRRVSGSLYVKDQYWEITSRKNRYAF